MSADLLRRAATVLRQQAQGTSPAPWDYNSYSVVMSGPKIRAHDEWQDAQFAAGHSLERNGACEACPNSPRCQLYTEDYRRDPLVAHVPSHHGDTAIEHAAKDAAYIERMHPPVALALADLLTAPMLVGQAMHKPCDECAHSDCVTHRRLVALARAVLREEES